MAERIALLTGRLRTGLEDLGCAVVSPPGPGAASGIVSFTDPRRDGGQLADELVGQGIHVSYPTGRSGSRRTTGPPRPRSTCCWTPSPNPGPGPSAGLDKLLSIKLTDRQFAVNTLDRQGELCRNVC
ncbi:hypothetical protein GXW82_31485 [Streptacidiphilus sp. 4-A2]|nr:hypothetical protein [Streptacidiphilus sp. 4-A2]